MRSSICLVAALSLSVTEGLKLPLPRLYNVPGRRDLGLPAAGQTPVGGAIAGSPVVPDVVSPDANLPLASASASPMEAPAADVAPTASADKPAADANAAQAADASLDDEAGPADPEPADGSATSPDPVLGDLSVEIPPSPADAPDTPDGPAPQAKGPDADFHRKGGKSGGGGPGKNRAGCPAIWERVARDLRQKMTEGGQCNDLARGAIRVAFHDCGSWKESMGTKAGCDGSLYLARDEVSRPENGGLTNVIPQLGQMAQQYRVGVADFFQVAGAVGIKACPGGPTVKTYVGRTDRFTPNPEGLIPNPRSSAKELLQNMGAKGFSGTELVALLGSHTAAKQFAFDTQRSGTPLDDSPGRWDVKFYSEVTRNKAPFILPSDKVLSQYKKTSGAWNKFGRDFDGWAAAFAPAMTKLSLSGVDNKADLIDCTSAIERTGGSGGYGRFDNSTLTTAPASNEQAAQEMASNTTPVTSQASSSSSSPSQSVGSSLAMLVVMAISLLV